MSKPREPLTQGFFRSIGANLPILRMTGYRIVHKLYIHTICNNVDMDFQRGNIMKTLNRTTKALVLVTAHKQVKAWLDSGLVFESYSNALSFALKKAWAAAKGSVVVFPWESKVPATFVAIDELVQSFKLEAIVKVVKVPVLLGSFNITMYQDLNPKSGFTGLYKACGIGFGSHYLPRGIASSKSEALKIVKEECTGYMDASIILSGDKYYVMEFWA